MLRQISRKLCRQRRWCLQCGGIGLLGLWFISHAALYREVVGVRYKSILIPSWQDIKLTSDNQEYHLEDGLEENYDYDDDAIPTGVISRKPKSFFRSLQQAVDREDPYTRCERYGFTYDPTLPQRRIFFGALVTDEPWELLEIVGAESYGIFSGMVFVESNRTQDWAPRKTLRLAKVAQLQRLFGVPNVQVRHFTENQNKTIRLLTFEHAQRQQILLGWKAQGMKPNDVGYIADADETATRDFLRAVQLCSGIEHFDYDRHHCAAPKIVPHGLVFESSPECIAMERSWHHPNMILGVCIDQIGNSTEHPLAPKDPKQHFRRAKGYGQDCDKADRYSKVIPPHYPLWTAGDFRNTCGGRTVKGLLNKTSSPFTAFHFHNFFADFNTTRFKYMTYGHPMRNGAFSTPLAEMGANLRMMYQCAKDLDDAEAQKWKRIVGGYHAASPPLPIYFHDDDYRRRRHANLKEQVEADDRNLAQLKKADKLRRS